MMTSKWQYVMKTQLSCVRHSYMEHIFFSQNCQGNHEGEKDFWLTLNIICRRRDRAVGLGKQHAQKLSYSIWPFGIYRNRSYIELKFSLGIEMKKLGARNRGEERQGRFMNILGHLIKCLCCLN